MMDLNLEIKYNNKSFDCGWLAGWLAVVFFLGAQFHDHHVIKMTKYSLSLLADIDQPNMNHNHNYYRP
ncbi:hypothetical protein DERF_015770 [Dermatophagoides farinae]|uniref:Uncharacterized protein n=1 Tax=Dermatophagoides farinae TaxID=6954 RepID=A0A922HF36_DERFA|nr:hypothetical protein DERF_015770 [Dermatophagoides farinae]